MLPRLLLLPLAAAVICVQDECYSEVFEPSVDWKVIREGQHIPQGLDVRLDMSTGEKTGRLSSGDGDCQVSHDVIPVDQPEDEPSSELGDFASTDPIDADVADEDINKLKRAYNDNTVQELSPAIDSLLKGHTTPLEALIEHSHDLQGGITIAERALQPLLELAKGSNYEVKEMALRVIAQCLRHNPEALEHVDVSTVLPQLIAQLPKENGVIQKRILGVMSTLVPSGKVDSEKLLGIFPLVDSQSKLRLLDTFGDLEHAKLVKRDVSEGLYEEVQDALSSGSIDEAHMEPIFDKLVTLKKLTGVKASPEFINWLVDEADKHRGSTDLYKKLKESRHLVFGNPNALRKNFDEL